ncbi:MAG: hypothetical protein IT303_08055 [Dehalococcoidia bacterium]|nr:hypothetical protein [Dehalococcoidia bacterium]
MTASNARRALTLAAFLAVGLLAVVVLADARGGRSQAEDEPLPQPQDITVTPTPTLLGRANEDAEEALRDIAGAMPAAAKTLDSVLAGDSAAALQAARSVRDPCETIIARGVSACEQRGVAPGTIITRATIDRAGSYYADVDDVAAALEHLLGSREPQLQLLATSGAGQLLAIIGVIPAPAFDLPGGVSDGPLRITRLQAFIDRDGTLLGISQVAAITPPPEVIRFDEHNGDAAYTIVFASAELKELEQAFHDELESDSRKP